VDGTGQVHVVTRHSKVGRALCSGMGLLGIITEVQLKLKVRGQLIFSSETRVAREAGGGALPGFGRLCAYKMLGVSDWLMARQQVIVS
jgi:hypothetical protein